MKKTISFKEINKSIQEISGKKKVLVGGCFDIFHFGHLTFLKKAKKEGDFLIVALESDEFIKKHKDRDPIHTQNQRAQILSSIVFVDLVIKLPLFKSDQEYQNLVELIKPKVIAVSENDPQVDKKNSQAELVGGKLKVVADLLQGYSTKNIIKVLNYESFPRKRESRKLFR